MEQAREGNSRMKHLIDRLLCRIGLHQWHQTRPLFVIDLFPPPGYWDHVRRQCGRCGRQEQWLPGYGGSELGCWMRESA